MMNYKSIYKRALICSLLFCFGLMGLNAQEESSTKEFTVNGLKVILKPSVKDVVSAKMFYRGGTSNYSKEFQGIELLTLRMMAEAGTTNMSKNDFNAAAEGTGTVVGNSAGYDYGTFSLRCVTQYWDDAWGLFSDAMCNPNWDEAELENIKQQMIANAQQSSSDPDTHLRNMAMMNAFGDGDYSKLPEGTEASIATLGVNNIKDYYKAMHRTSRAFLVVVGNISERDLRSKVEGLTCIKEMPVKPSMSGTQKSWTENAYGEEEREIATNYIRGMMSAPEIGGKDETAMRVAMSIMGDKMFEEVRTKRNLSYAPSAFFPSGVLNNPYTAMYVSTDKPNEAIQVMTDEFRKVRQYGFDAADLENKKGEFLTQYYMGQETNSSQVDLLGRYENACGWKRTESFMDEVYALSVDDLNKVFKKHITNVSWTYLGDTSIVDKEVFLKPIMTIEEKADQVVEEVQGKIKKKKKKKKKKEYGF